MADVIPLAPRRRRRKAAEGSLPAHGAEILFFTGVRYERQPEATPRRRSSAGRRPQAKPGCAKRTRRKA